MSENRLIAEIVLDQNLEKPLDYAVPAALSEAIRIGMRAEVPLKGSTKKGTVVALKSSSLHAVRDIVRLMREEASLSPPLWTLAIWMAKYYCTPLQRVLKCLTPPNVRKEVRPKIEFRAALAITHAEALKLCETMRAKVPAQADILEALLKADRPLRTAELKRSPLQSLIQKKAVVLQEMPAISMDEADFFPSKPKTLNGEQQQCLDAIAADLAARRFQVHLVHGVTGSGKTEVYLRAIQKTLDSGRSAILLVPEIALTSQTIERFRARFGLRLAILHHRRSLGERTAAWESLQRGEVKIAIGARSAVFSPAKNLGLIIVDEEHDSSYKQSEEAPTYHARDIAIVRAQIEGAVVVLGSATPSLESAKNGETKKYHLSVLKNRATSAQLPHVRILDMKAAFDKAGGFTHFSPELLEAIEERMEKGEQTLLLLNRRGYRRMQLCAECRAVIKCPHCDLSLTYHRNANRLSCHLCDFSREVPRECPSCKASSTLEFKGFGTEHVESSLHAIFPEIRTLRMDRDTTRKKESHEELFKQFRAHKADVLIGTQMIAKGFHFPSATLVGILNADAALQIPDFRAAETVFQLIMQVAGRAGRAELPGQVILQTFMPDHPLLKLAAAQDYDSFYKREIEERLLFSFPPFCHLIKIVFSGEDEGETMRAAIAFRAALIERASHDAQFLPPLPAGHAKVKDRYRIQFLIKTKNALSLSSLIQRTRQEFALSKKISLLIDVDPISTFF